MVGDIGAIIQLTVDWVACVVCPLLDSLLLRDISYLPFVCILSQSEGTAACVNLSYPGNEPLQK